VAVLSAVVAMVLAAGCGVSTNDKPEPISGENLDEVLANGSPGATLPVNPQDTVPVTIWLLKSDPDAGPRLTDVPRRAPLNGADPVDPTLWLETLLGQTPTEAENAQGFSTAIPLDAHLTDTPIRSGSVLVVSLSTDFYSLRGDTGRAALGQLVYTATEIPGITAVSFEVEGDPVPVLDGNGESVDDRPVRRADYVALVPGG
jgi:spore germination protein GerM